ncbi:hypothetical protein FVP74_08315 [Microbacterium saccharophilum]|uniref:Uncharacterized protein n=1 Tax=Microbacterium saccharophilum TaxID=1213358 RepID=A0A5C8HYE2_9MICO|nr:hypothetical protein [Microbacterium saccharophilum]TXK11335.1 hypothetical protein FVP74_08315 [Microbacterium saccharophilum]
MEWIATGVAVIAALVAGWQAWEARRARIDARESAGEAQQHEERAAAASERIAAAIEEQNALERAERERYRNPWTMSTSRDKSSRSYKFMLGGDEPISDVSIKIDDEHAEREHFRFVKPQTETMRPGESMSLHWLRHMGSASQITVELHWTRQNGEQHHSPVTLD